MNKNDRLTEKFNELFPLVIVFLCYSLNCYSYFLFTIISSVNIQP
jgi:hypothetical protein